MRELKLILQSFADGGATDGSASGEASAAQGAVANAADDTSADASSKKRANPFEYIPFEVDTEESTQGNQSHAACDADETNKDKGETFEELIKGKYKKDYDKAVQKILTQRFKESKATEERYNALKPALDIIAKKYNLSGDSEDFATRLSDAVLDDDSYYEDEAYSSGESVATVKERSRLQAEVDRLKAENDNRIRQEQADKWAAEVRAKVEETKREFPNFDLDTEMENETFKRMIFNGMHPTDAFVAVHRREILSSTVRNVANATKSQVSASIASGMARPTEGAVNSTPATATFDPKNMTKEERERIKADVRRGKKISF